MIGEGPGSNKEQVLTGLPGGLTQAIQIVAEPGHSLPYGEAGRQKMEQAAAEDPDVAAALELLKMITSTARRPLADIDWNGDIKAQLLQKLEDYIEVIVFDVEDAKYFAENSRDRLSAGTNEPGKDSFLQRTERLEEKYRRLYAALERFPKLLERYQELLSKVQAMKDDVV